MHDPFYCNLIGAICCLKIWNVQKNVWNELHKILIPYNNVRHALIFKIIRLARVQSLVLAFRNAFSVRLGYYEGWNFNSGNYLFTTDTK